VPLVPLVVLACWAALAQGQVSQTPPATVTPPQATPPVNPVPLRVDALPAIVPGGQTTPQAGTPVALPLSVPPSPQPFKFNIDPKTPVKDLLPVPPSVKKQTGPVLTEDLTKVREVEFQAPLAKNLPGQETHKQTAHMLAKINHLNAKKADGFLEALLGERRDLVGMPFAMGDACRSKGERSKQFNLAVNTVRRAMQSGQGMQATFPQVGSGPQPPGIMNIPVQGPVAPATFWDTYLATVAQEDKAQPRSDNAQHEHVTLARIAALMQMLAPESPAMRLGLVKYLTGVAHVEATRALARLAIFSAEGGVRQAAIDALKVRRERDYTDVLVQGLHYPLPAVAKRASEAIVQLERKDLLPQLVDLLEEPDPRAPMAKEDGDKKRTVVRELVRVNHHRNCMLCHAPGNSGNVSAEALTAGIPVPNEPLNPPSFGYQSSVPDILVRIDVTYLRQDFSMMQAVADANPWPEMQRFDFLVRTREVNEEEAAAYRKALEKREPGEVTPYQRAALSALRELTGKDGEPTPEAWRKLLKLEPRKTMVH
jgi:hypothetical protein